MNDGAAPEGNAKCKCTACLQFLQHLATSVHTEIILMSFGLIVSSEAAEIPRT